MSKSNLSPFDTFSLMLKKKQEDVKKQVCSLIDANFNWLQKEFARIYSTSHSESVSSSSRNIEDKVMKYDAHENSLGIRKPGKESISANLNLNSTKQRSTNKRKSTSNVVQTCKPVKRYKIEKKCKVYENALNRACMSSSSNDSVQEIPIVSSTKSKELGKESKTKQCNDSGDMPIDRHTCQVFSVLETVSESLFNTEMELNKAMLGVFFDGNSKYFVCDIKQHGMHKSFYKVYNVQAARLHSKKPFSHFSEFQHYFIKPIKFDSSIAVNTRVLVAWNLNDSELTPATIKAEFYQHQKVEVQNNKGQVAVISIHDVFILPNYIPIMSDASDVSDAFNSTTEPAQTKMYREKPIMDEIYNKYAENNQKYAEDKCYLEGIWRWADYVESGSLIEFDDNKLVNANIFQSIYKNNRIKFSVGDDVVVWDSTEKASYKYPIIGVIKKLYENITTKQKRVQFCWYLHTAEYPDSGLKPLNNGLVESSEWSVVDVDYLLSDGDVVVMPFSEYQATHLEHNFVLDDVEQYRLSLLKNPFRTYFKAGIYCHERKVYKLDPTLSSRKDEFFLSS